MPTDAELICAWMEPKPSMSTYDRERSWWYMPKDAFVPLPLTLDSLHEVEAKLTDDQWDRYSDRFDYPARARNRKPLLHATAAQKIKALAAVIREATNANV